MSETVEIVRLGHAGHGVTANGLFVPYALPGDVVRIARDGERGRLEEIVTPGPWRSAAPCAHFGTCGGCALQHVAPERYSEWKRELIATALAHRGFADIEIAPVRAVPPGSRRRAMFKARAMGKSVALGFYEPESHRLVDIAECPVLTPALARLVSPLRDALRPILEPGETAELHCTETDSGVDLSLKLKGARTPDLLMDLGELANRLDLARLSWNGEPVAIAREPVLRIGRFTVALPPEPFLQPTRHGERLLQDLARDGIGQAERIADLFCGCGTFTLALAEGRKLHAVDVGGAMIDALAAAARAGRGEVATEARDLFRRPLEAAELAGFEAVVIDPPRPGAKAQIETLARSSVPRIVYISCNPASFARDARILGDGGYRLGRVTPVDQFLWSAHIELAATFTRTGT